jgi:hypothetical protein
MPALSIDAHRVGAGEGVNFESFEEVLNKNAIKNRTMETVATPPPKVPPSKEFA